MALPDRSDTGRGNKYALGSQFVGDAHLAPSRPLKRTPTDHLLGIGGYTVLQTGLPTSHLLQGQLTAPVIELFEPVEAISRVAEYLAGT